MSLMAKHVPHRSLPGTHPTTVVTWTRRTLGFSSAFISSGTQARRSHSSGTCLTSPLPVHHWTFCHIRLLCRASRLSRYRLVRSILLKSSTGKPGTVIVRSKGRSVVAVGSDQCSTKKRKVERGGSPRDCTVHHFQLACKFAA